jgi:hypothetical protein
MREFDAFSSIEFMSPTALLMIPAEKETLVLFYMDAIKATYEKAQPRKDMIVLPNRHFQIYCGSAMSWYAFGRTGLL